MKFNSLGSESEDDLNPLASPSAVLLIAQWKWVSILAFRAKAKWILFGVIQVFAVCGCGSSDPLNLKQAKTGDAIPATTESRTDESKPNAAPQVVAPTLVDIPLSETQPGQPPEELVARIRQAAEHLAKHDNLPAIEILVDPQSLASQNLTPAAAAGNMPKINATLMAGTLRQAAKSPARFGAEGSYVLFEVSDSTHVRFNRISNVWRMSDNLRPDGSAPGLSYDEAGPHAAFLLKKLADVEPLPKEQGVWSPAEQPIVAELEKLGAGFARGKRDNGKPVTAMVLNRTFQGEDASLAKCLAIEGLEVAAFYETKITAAGLKSLSPLPELRGVRLMQNLVTNDVVAALAGLTRLETLSITALQREFVDLKPLGALKSLRRLELIGLSFDPVDLVAFQAAVGLKTLDLSRSTVDDAALKRLEALKSLEQLRISTDTVTLDGVVSLQRAVPNLFIDW